MTRTISVDSAARAAAAGAFAIIANQVSGKAARDALFLSTFGIEALPRMVLASALLAILVVLVTARWLTRHGPAKLTPGACVLSVLVLLAIWALEPRAPRAAAVALFLHVSVSGSVLISWFWSVINERFDPRTAKRRIGWIAGGGAAGGFAGGLVAERFAHASLPITRLLLVLAGLHLVAGLVIAWMGRGGARASHPESEPADAGWAAGLGLLRRRAYIRNLARFVLLTTMAAALIDFLFKSQAAAAYADRAQLLRFFAVFYAVTGLATLALQWTLSRRSLERLGIARTASLLPAAVAGGSVTLLVPGLLGVWVTTAVRGLETILRSSVFRSSYELLYTPVPPREKRSTKTLVDVGFDRLGDVFGAGVVQIALLAGARASMGTASRPVLVVLAATTAALGVVGFVVARRLGHGYVAALESSLLAHGPAFDTPIGPDVTTRTIVLQTIMGLRPDPSAPGLRPGVFHTPAPEPTTAPPADPLAGVIADLGSGVPARVHTAIAGLAPPLDPRLVPHLARLLGWDEVFAGVARLLRPQADAIAVELGEMLADPSEEFVIRRRIPRVLSAGESPPVVEALARGLADVRFEVRYQCGAALLRIHDRNPSASIERARILATIQREAAVDRRVWESHRLLDKAEPTEDTPFVDEVLRQRSSRGLEHVFTLLSLAYPKQPLRIAYQGLLTDDPTLRGTALEYLESIVAPAIREHLWPLLEDHRKKAAPVRSQEDVLASLLRSHASIQVNLEELRKRRPAES